MRIALDEEDVAGRLNFELLGGHDANIQVFVDGDHLRNVIAADDEQGWAVTYVTSDRNEPIRNGDHWVTRQVHGKVCISVNGRRVH